MEFRQAKETDISGIRDLWKRCFGDEDDYLNFYIKEAYRPSRTWLCADGTLPISMMTLLPACVEDEESYYQGGYVYAVATLPEYRHQGLMSQLHERVEEACKKEGFSFLSLVPAELSLFSMYRKLGYEVCAQLYYDTVSKKDGKLFSAKTCFEPIRPEQFLDYRLSYLRQQGAFLRLQDDCWEYTEKELSAAGYSYLGIENKLGKGYLVYHINKIGHLRIREAGVPEDCLRAAIGDICRYFEVPEFFIKLPWGGFSGKENRRPFAMMKKLNATVPGQVYTNLMLDD